MLSATEISQNAPRHLTLLEHKLVMISQKNVHPTEGHIKRSVSRTKRYSSALPRRPKNVISTFDDLRALLPEYFRWLDLCANLLRLRGESMMPRMHQCMKASTIKLPNRP